MQLHLILIDVQMVYWVLDAIKCFYLRHPEFSWERIVQHFRSERRFGLLYQNIHSVWGAPFDDLLHMAKLLLEVSESLLPCLLSYYRWGSMRLHALSASSAYRLVFFPYRGWWWAVSPGLTGFRLCLGIPGNNVAMSSLMWGNVVAFPILTLFLGVLHLSGELFYLLYQTLVDEAECFHFVGIGLDCFCRPWWPAVCISRRIGHSCGISVAPARVPRRYHQQLRNQLCLCKNSRSHKRRQLMMLEFLDSNWAGE